MKRNDVLLAIAFGVALSFAVIAFGSAPTTVVKEPTIITPVPTPQVIYVYDSPESQQQSVQPIHTPTSSTTLPPDMVEDTQAIIAFATLLPLVVIGVGIVTIIASAFATAR